MNSDIEEIEQKKFELNEKAKILALELYNAIEHTKKCRTELLDISRQMNNLNTIQKNEKNPH